MTSHILYSIVNTSANQRRLEITKRLCFGNDPFRGIVGSHSFTVCSACIEYGSVENTCGNRDADGLHNVTINDVTHNPDGTCCICGGCE